MLNPQRLHDCVIIHIVTSSSSGTKLQCGIEYVVIVRATNMVGLSRVETSDGFTVDGTAPSSGQVVIISPSPGHFDIRQIAAR